MTSAASPVEARAPATIAYENVVRRAMAENFTPLEGLLSGLIHGRHPSPKATSQNNDLGQLLCLSGLLVENGNPAGAAARTEAAAAPYIDPCGFSKYRR